MFIDKFVARSTFLGYLILMGLAVGIFILKKKRLDLS